MLLLLLAATAAVTTPPMPPPIVRYPAPPMITVVPAPTRPMVSDAPDPAPVTYEVAVTADGQTLYRGAMRVARGGRASFSQTYSQSAAHPCVAANRWGAGERTTFSLEVVRDQMSRGSETNVYVSVDWLRPLAVPACTDGSRSASLRQSLELVPGARQSLRGDAGLQLVITRR